MRLHKLCAVMVSIALTIGSFAGTTAVRRAQAAEQTTENLKGADTDYAGLDVEYRTQEQIKDFYKSHPIKNMEAEFSEEPSAAMPYSLGKMTEETIQDALNMLNLFRYIAGVPTVSVSEKAQNHAQAAALITAINREASHVALQPQGMSDEMYALAVYGTANSNLATGGNKLCDNIIRYMLETNGDPGFGHRRQLLDYYCTETGFGLAKSVTGGYYSATFVDANLKEDRVISYPGQNQPLEYFGPGYAWTVVVPEKVDKSSVTVKLTDTRTGKTWDFDDSSNRLWVSNSFESSCVIFSPFEINYRAGDKYRVEITGIDKPISYEVNIFLLADKPIPVESISCDFAALYVQEGTVSTGSLMAECTPENASNQIVKWTSSDPEIAEPVWNGTGTCKVKAKKPGTALFTATSEDGGHKTYVEIYVTPTPESIELSETDVTIGVGQSFELSAKSFPKGTYDWPDFKYDFDSNIIKREETGSSGKIKITGKAVGETSITAYSIKNKALTKVCRIKVVEPVYTESLSLDQTEIEMFKKDTVKLNTIVSPSNITCKNIKWISSDTNIVKVKDGVVSYGGSNLIGEAEVTAKAMDGSGKEATCKVKVFGKYEQKESPWAVSATSDTVTLEVVENCEYSMDKVNWQDSNVFTGLEADREYTFYIRRKANEKHFMKAGDPSEGAVVKTSGFIAPGDCTHKNKVIRNVIDPSCRECGYTGDTYCADCRIKDSRGDIIPSLGHEYKSEVTKKATYTQDGIRTYTCIRCEDSYTEKILSIMNGGTASDNEEKDPETEPTAEPTIEPTIEPTAQPTIEPTIEPTAEPTIKPTAEPTIEPTIKPTAEPTIEPTIEPTAEPTIKPTAEPSIEPTAEPSVKPEDEGEGDNNIDNWDDTTNQENEEEKDRDNNDKSTLKKGSKFNVGSCRYRVLSSSSVSLIGLKNKKASRITVPKTVKVKGKTYTVTQIAKNALRKTKVTHVTIGAMVTKIGDGAFRECKKLKSITIKTTRLKSVGKNAFKGIRKNAKIKVPAGKLREYKKLLKGKGQGKKVKIVK